MKKFDQSGFLTVDFIFATVLVFALTGIIFVLGTTLTVVEVSQYVAYSAARGYLGGHMNEQRQEQLGQKSYQDLMGTSIGGLLNNRYFRLGGASLADFGSDQDSRNSYYGSEIPLSIPALNFSVPFFGATSTNAGAFNTTVRAYLGREPTQEECEAFSGERWNKITTTLGYTAPNASPPAIINDNGC